MSFFNDDFRNVIQKAIEKLRAKGKVPFSTIDLIIEQWGGYHTDKCSPNESINANIGKFLKENMAILGIEEVQAKKQKKKTSTSVWKLVANLSFAMMFIFSCSDEPTEQPPDTGLLSSEQGESSSSAETQAGISSSSQAFNNCVIDGVCLQNIPIEYCLSSGGAVMQNCPISSSSFAFSSSSAVSSSSGEEPSSNSIEPSSSSAVSSSSGEEPSSSSVEPPSSSIVSSSSSITPSSSSVVPSSSSSLPSVLCRLQNGYPCTQVSQEMCEKWGTPVQSCSEPPSYGSLTYDGQTYKTIEIGNSLLGIQTWMAENLNYKASDSKCYNNSNSNCDEYGRLYTWATAMNLESSCNYIDYGGCSQVQIKHKGICPSGWHLPSNEEWNILINFAGGVVNSFLPSDDRAGKYLKATNGWNYISSTNKYGNGTDEYGFSALPGGQGYSDSSFDFDGIGYRGHWWSASASGYNSAYSCSMNYLSEYADTGDAIKSDLFSVRCVQD